MTAYDSADRFIRGVGPEPRSWQVSRDYTPPLAALGETAVCGTCGGVYLVAKGHRCSRRKAAQ